MRILSAARRMSAPELPSAHVECGGLPPLPVAEACLGDSTDAITKRNRSSAQRPSGNHGSPVTIHQSRFSPQQSDTPCRVIDDPVRVVVPSESAVADGPRDLSAILSDTPCQVIDDPVRVVVPSESAVADEPRDLSAILSDTPCQVISLVSHRKQTIGTLTKCHTKSYPPRAICWPTLRAFRIISAPISDKEPRVQGR